MDPSATLSSSSTSPGRLRCSLISKAGIVIGACIVLAIAFAAAGAMLVRHVEWQKHASRSEIAVDIDDDSTLEQPPEYSALFAAFLVVETIAGALVALLFILRTQSESGMRGKIARSEMRFRVLAENAPGIVLRYDANLRLVYANPAYAREIRDRRLDFPKRDGNEPAIWLPTMARERYRERLRRVMETGASDRMNWEWQSRSGQPVAHEIQLIAEFDDAKDAAGVLVIGRNVSERKEIERQLQHHASHDVLTGLPNRILLKDRLQHAIARAWHEGHRLAVVFVDIDRFKDNNDSLGLDSGDQLLALQAKRLTAALPESDTVARLGGDEFVVLLEDSVPDQDWEHVVQRLRESIAQGCDIAGHRIYPTSSVGIAIFPEHGDDAGTLMRHAETALCVAKGEGGNRYRFFSPDMNEELHEWMKLSSDLHLAIENREFVLHYQPKIRLDGGELCGMEALIRWHHPDRGLILPATFIPIAEKTGMIGAIGSWVLDEACRQAKAWLDEGLDPGRVAINLSAVQCGGTELPLRIKQALGAHSLSARHLEVEITESIAMADTEESIRAFWSLRDMGVKISVDDFGTGYSSLSYLKRLPVDKLKIDKSFIDDIEVDSSDAEIIRAIVAMAHSLKLETIAEGVETSLQFEFLRGLGCDQMQGYYFSPAVPAAEMATILRSRERPAHAA